jgi:hypothetical protein
MCIFNRLHVGIITGQVIYDVIRDATNRKSCLLSKPYIGYLQAIYIDFYNLSLTLMKFSRFIGLIMCLTLRMSALSRY